MCTLCDSTNINAIIEFVPHVSDDGFSGGSDSYLHFRDKHAPCILKLCVPPSNGIGRWWLFSPNLVRNCSWTFVPRQSFWIILYLASLSLENGNFENMNISTFFKELL